VRGRSDRARTRLVTAGCWRRISALSSVLRSSIA
jgi:hypothetical protein